MRWRLLRDTRINFQQISWRSTETSAVDLAWWSLSFRLSDQQQPSRDQLRPTEITEWPRDWREFTQTVAIVGRLLRDHWKTGETFECSLRDRWAFTESPLPSGTTERLFWTSSKFDGDHADHSVHWKVMEDLGDHWVLCQICQTLVKLCGLSMVSQQSRLWGKWI